MTGLPVKFLGTGEKTDALEVFHPDRLAGRILGMGDILTLVERAQEHVDAGQAAEEKMRKGSFTLDDMLDSMQQMQKMGPLGQVMSMIPGMGNLAGEAQAAVDRGDLKRTEAIIRAMTPHGTPRPDRPQQLAPAADRRRLGHHAAGRQPAGEAIPRDAEAHEAASPGAVGTGSPLGALTRTAHEPATGSPRSPTSSSGPPAHRPGADRRSRTGNRARTPSTIPVRRPSPAQRSRP